MLNIFHLSFKYAKNTYLCSAEPVYSYNMPYKHKEDQRIASAKHYQQNKARVKQRTKEFTAQTRLKHRRLINDYLSNHPCVDCGETDIIVLEFDHVRGIKESDISTAISSGGWSFKKILYEIAKCDVRCANCHRRVTYQRRLTTITTPKPIKNNQLSLFDL